MSHDPQPFALPPDHETLTQIVKLTKGKPSTVKLRLKELVEKGYILPKGRGAHYVKKRQTWPQRLGLNNN